MDNYDASYDEVTIPYDQLLHVAGIAQFLAKEALNTKLKKWYDFPNYDKIGEVYADDMLETAKMLRDSTICYYHLMLGKDRSTLTITRDGMVVPNKEQTNE